MTAEALAQAKIESTATSGTSQGGYHGFYTKRVKDRTIYICVYFNQPSKLIVETAACNIDEHKQLERGNIEDKSFRIELNLASEEVHFFARSKQSQLSCLEEFLSESVQYAEQLIREKS
jgi:hypothetical protein